MHPEWNELVGDQAAAGAGAAAEHVATGGGVFGALPDVAVLRAAGGDTTKFLQGQLTCDVDEVGPATSRLGAWCNAKGRVSVLFRLLADDAGVDLLLPRSQLEATRGRLGMYVLRADVTLAEMPDLLCFWASGGPAVEALREHLGDLPVETDAVAKAGGARIVRLGGPGPTYLGVVPAAELEALWAALRRSPARLAGVDAFELDRIRAAEPAVLPETADAFVPQMINLELLGGISFTKGCFIGQEVVARTQHLGKLKRRMFRARIGADDTTASAGDPIYGDAGSGGQSVGSVVRAAAGPDGAYEILTVLRLDAAETGGLHLHQILGPPLELLEIPYALAPSERS